MVIPFPTTPKQAVELNWRLGAENGTPVAMVNGTKISSTTPEDVLRRLETWLRKNDAGKDGQPIVLEVMGHKTMVLTPVERNFGLISCGPLQITQRFRVMLWYLGKEYENLVMDFQTCVWESEKKVRSTKGY